MTDPYIYRAVNYRNQVAHRHRNPLHYHLELPSGVRKTFLHLDPRNPVLGPSKVEALPELAKFHAVVSKKCLELAAKVT
jgi:hypothetical protein